MSVKRGKPSEMRYKPRCETTAKPQKGGLPSESLYRIRARQSRQFGDERRSRRTSMARDGGPRDAPPVAASRERSAGRDDALRGIGAGAAIRAAVSCGAAARRGAEAVQEARALPRVGSRAGTDVHAVRRRG